MKCPQCHYSDTKVVDSRLTGEGESIRRRRECLKCKYRFTTYEYVEHVPLMIVKKDGRRQAFEREKMIAGLIKACEKRPVSIDQIEKTVSDIEKIIHKKYDREVMADVLGEIVMDKLMVLDEVAYVRFASVYRQFKDVSQFMKELKGIIKKDTAEQL